MQWIARSLGWGVVIYAVMYLVWSGLVIYGLSLGILSLIVRLVVLVLVTTIAARSTRLPSWERLLPFSISWAVVTLVLDALFLVPFSGWALYSSWSVWAGYALVVLAPLVTTAMRHTPSSGASRVL